MMHFSMKKIAGYWIGPLIFKSSNNQVFTLEKNKGLLLILEDFIYINYIKWISLLFLLILLKIDALRAALLNHTVLS